MSILNITENDQFVTLKDIYDILVSISFDNPLCDECIKGFDLQKHISKVDGTVNLRHHRYSIKKDIEEKLSSLAGFDPGYQNIKKVLFEYLKDEIKPTAVFAILGRFETGTALEFKLYPYGIDKQSLISVCITHLPQCPS